MDFYNILKIKLNDGTINFMMPDIDIQLITTTDWEALDSDNIMQMQIYKNIVSIGFIPIHTLYTAYRYCKDNSDYEYEYLAEVIEKMADEFDLRGISCYFYSFYLSAILSNIMDFFNDYSLRDKGLEDIKWHSMQLFSYSGTKIANLFSQTFGVGRFFEKISDFKIVNGVLIEYLGKSPHVIIPDTVYTIGDNAFAGCKYLRTVFMPDNVKDMGKHAFGECPNLESVTLSSNLTELADGAFFADKRLKRINLDHITKIGDLTFADCVLLRNIKCDSLEEIGNGAFQYCINIVDNCEFISHLKKIGDEAFKACPMDYVILEKCVNLGAFAFADNTSLTRITFKCNIENMGETPFFNDISVTLVDIQGSIPDKVHKLFESKKIIFNKKNEALKCIKFDNINMGECDGYTSLKAIGVRNSTSVAPYAFRNCAALTDIVFAKEIEDIGISAFDGCISLENLDIIFNGTKIPARAFYKCGAISKFDFLDQVDSFGEKSMAYNDLTQFNFQRTFKKISAFAFANCRYPESISLMLGSAIVLPGAFHGVNKVKTIDIDSLSQLYDNQIYKIFDETRDAAMTHDISNIIIHDGFNNDAFRIFQTLKYAEISINNGIVPANLFEGCTNIESIKINGKVKTIGISAFSGCSSLTKLDMDYDILNIGDKSFMACNNASKLIDLSRVIRFGELSMAMTDIANLELNNTTQYIGKGAFAMCYQINNVVLPFSGEMKDAIRENSCLGYIFAGKESEYKQSVIIDNMRYEFNMPKLEEVTIWNDTLSKYSLSGIDFLKNIYIPNVTSISGQDFEGCSNIQGVYVGDALNDIIVGEYSLPNIIIPSSSKYYKKDETKITSINGRELYYLYDTSKVHDIINDMDVVHPYAIREMDDIVELHSAMELKSNALNCKNTRVITIGNNVKLSKSALYNISSIHSVNINDNTSIEYLHTEPGKHYSLDSVNINGCHINKLVDIYDENVSLDIDKLTINNIDMDENTLINIDRINILEINNCGIGSGLLDNSEVNNIIIDSLTSDITSFRSRPLRVKNFKIGTLDIIPYMFENTNIDRLELGDVGDIDNNAFSNANIEELVIDNVNGNVDINAFSNANIGNIVIKNGIGFNIIDGVLYYKGYVLYCFDKNISTYVLPNFVTRVSNNTFKDLPFLTKFVSFNPDIAFDKNSIVNCPKLQEIIINNINLPLYKIIDNINSITKVTYIGETLRTKILANMSSLKEVKLMKTKRIETLAFALDNMLVNVDGLDKVGNIGSFAFYGCDSLKNINIEANSVGMCAFSGCENISSLGLRIDDYQIEHGFVFEDIASNVDNIYIHSSKVIPDKYFDGVKSNIHIDGSVEQIGGCAFRNVDSLSIDSMENVTFIGESALENNRLFDIALPNVEYICKHAFKNTKNVQSISIGANACEISYDFMEGCDNQQLTIDVDNKKYSSYQNCLVDDGVLVASCKNNKITQIELDNHIKKVASYAFKDSNINSLIVNDVEEIETDAFENVKSLHSVKISNIAKCHIGILNGCVNVHILNIDYIDREQNSIDWYFGTVPSKLSDITINNSISENDLATNNNIINITLGKAIDKIPQKFLSRCEKLECFKALGAIKNVENDTFKNLSNLLTINIPELTIIGANAFEGTKSLSNINLCNASNIGEFAFKDSGIIGVKLPKIRSIGNGAFLDADRLQYIVLGPKIIRLNDRTFDGCSELRIVTGADNICSIGKRTFANCQNLANLELGKIDKLQKQTFYRCKKLTNVIGIEDITCLPSEVFYGCENLNMQFNNVTCIEDYALSLAKKMNVASLFPGIEHVGSYAFEETVADNILLPSIKTIGDNAFINMKNVANIDISSDAKKIGSTPFKGINTIKNIAVPLCIDNFYTIKDFGCGTHSIENITIKKGGIAYNTFDECVAVKSITIPSDMTKLEQCYFYGLEKLTTVLGTCNITHIGAKAFFGCKALSNMDMRNVESIGDFAFMGCCSFNNTLANVKTIGDGAFKNTSITNVTSKNIVSIGESAFEHSDLTSIDTHALTILMPRVFAATHIKSINIASANKICEGACYDCAQLEKVYNMDFIKYIGDNAFANCKKLIDVNKLTNLECIGDAAFYNCQSLADVRITQNLQYIGTDAFAFTNMGKNKIYDFSSVTRVGHTLFRGVDAPTIYINKRHDKDWPNDWNKGCKKHGFLGLSSSAIVKKI